MHIEIYFISVILQWYYIFNNCLARYDNFIYSLLFSSNEPLKYKMYLIMLPVSHYFNVTVFMPAVVFGLMNSLVHMVMYLYYALAAIGPHMKKYLWWKQYMTKLQLVYYIITIFRGYALYADINEIILL